MCYGRDDDVLVRDDSHRDESEALPDWAVVPPRKVSESRLSEADTSKAEGKHFVLSPLDEDKAVQRGNAVHHVLEHLPLDAASKTRYSLIRRLTRYWRVRVNVRCR